MTAMGIDVKDLPPAYQAQALRKWAEQERKKGRDAALSPAARAPRKASKYHNKPTERVTSAGKVLRFDSQKEARRYDELMVMLHAGKIRDLRLQADFTLQEAYRDSEGKRVRAIRYRADLCPSWPFRGRCRTGRNMALYGSGRKRTGFPWWRT